MSQKLSDLDGRARAFARSVCGAGQIYHHQNKISHNLKQISKLEGPYQKEQL